jgi:hypothetical protein
MPKVVKKSGRPHKHQCGFSGPCGSFAFSAAMKFELLMMSVSGRGERGRLDTCHSSRLLREISLNLTGPAHSWRNDATGSLRTARLAGR